MCYNKNVEDRRRQDNMENKIQLKVFGKMAFIMGIGGFLAYYFIQYIKFKVPMIAAKIRPLIMEKGFQAIHIEGIEFFIFASSLFLLLLAPFLIECGKKENTRTWIHIFILIFLCFINSAGIIISIARGNIFFAYIIVIWVSSIYVTWIMYNTMKKLYQWIKISTERESFDIVKMTFIWTILAFIIGKVW